MSDVCSDIRFAQTHTALYPLYGNSTLSTKTTFPMRTNIIPTKGRMSIFFTNDDGHT